LLAARQMTQDLQSVGINNSHQNFTVLQNTRQKAKAKKAYIAKTKAVTLITLTILFALAYTAMGAIVTSYGYKINEMKMAISDVQSANDRLTWEVEKLSSSERIATYAKQNLGMVNTQSGNILYKEIDVASISNNPVNALSAQVPSAQVEVLAGQNMHPVLKTLKNLWSGFLAKKELVTSKLDDSK